MPVLLCQLPLGSGSVTVSAQGLADLRRLEVVSATCSAEVSLALVTHSRRQVAGPRMAMLDLARRRKAEAFFRSLMRFLLGHD